MAMKQQDILLPRNILDLYYTNKALQKMKVMG
jgi:hypothetical protein